MDNLGNIYLAILLIALASAYASYVLQETTGPFGLATWLRRKVGITEFGYMQVADDYEWVNLNDAGIDSSADEVEAIDRKHHGRYWAQVFHCYICMSPYISLTMTAVYLVAPLIVFILAISGAVVLLRKVM